MHIRPSKIFLITMLPPKIVAEFIIKYQYFQCKSKLLYEESNHYVSCFWYQKFVALVIFKLLVYNECERNT